MTLLQPQEIGLPSNFAALLNLLQGENGEFKKFIELQPWKETWMLTWFILLALILGLQRSNPMKMHAFFAILVK